MKQFSITVNTNGKGLYLITNDIIDGLGELPNAGLVNIFIHHTSASLMIQENADPTAKKDLNTFYELLAPENQSWHTHTVEGPDDTTSHLKASLTQTSLNVPIISGHLGLGTWQGIYLFEHRQARHQRKLTITILNS